MKLFDIMIGNKSYEFVNSVHYNGKNYVAYSDKDNIYINEFVIEENNVRFLEVDEATFEEVKKVLSL